MDSILETIKTMLGDVDHGDSFDTDLKVLINSCLWTLKQIGVGSKASSSVDDSSTLWSDFLLDQSDYDAAKEYVYLKVRMVFDPPSVSSVLTAMEDRAKELEWRLSVQSDYDQNM